MHSFYNYNIEIVLYIIINLVLFCYIFTEHNLDLFHCQFHNVMMKSSDSSQSNHDYRPFCNVINYIMITGYIL